MFALHPANIYLFKVSNRITRKRCEKCSKFTITVPKRRQWRLSWFFVVNFEHMSHLLVFLLLKVVSAIFLLVLFCMSKGEHLWSKEKCFLFYFKSTFRSWDKILTFRICKCHDVIKCRSMNMKHILLNNSGSKDSLVVALGQFM